MLNRFMRMTSAFTRQKTSQSAAWVVFVRDTVSGFMTTAHHALMMLGIVAIGALALMFVKPEVADQLKELSPFAVANADELDAATPVAASLLETPARSITQAAAADSAKPAAAKDDAGMLGNSRQQQWVTAWLSKRYRVASDATNMLVSAAYLTAKELKLDPLLILAVMAIESGFNPFAESPVGAQGLMQVMSKVHHDKFQELGGVKAALNPVANIRVGSLILKDYVTRGGSVEAGLKLYVGAGALDTDFGYGAKVLAEYRRLKEVAMGKKVPVYATSVAKPRQDDTKNTPAETQAVAPEASQPVVKVERVAAL